MLERDIIVDDIRCRGIGNLSRNEEFTIRKRKKSDGILKPILSDWQAWFEVDKVGLKCLNTPVYSFDDLYFGDQLNGPCLIQQNTSTIVIEPDCKASINKQGSIIITVGSSENSQNYVSTELDDIQLSIFGHRFMSIAEQMGKTLQRTSVSTNIKERLDFSCAIFGPNGDLVANAPHLPVHLGSMQEAVRYQINKFGSNIIEGDVIVSNHPCSGGTHLPDITVMTPVFDNSSQKNSEPVFWVASRGHHADIGGIAPGSMPPFSKYLNEEGAAIEGLKLVSNGKFNESEIVDILKNPKKEQLNDNKNCVGTRNLSDNLSDLKAQIAANQKGISLMKSLINEYSLEVVQAYMFHIQNNAQQSVRNKLIQIGKKYKNVSSLRNSGNDNNNKSNFGLTEQLYDPRNELQHTDAKTDDMIVGNDERCVYSLFCVVFLTVVSVCCSNCDALKCVARKCVDAVGNTHIPTTKRHHSSLLIVTINLNVLFWHL